MQVVFKPHFPAFLAIAACACTCTFMQPCKNETFRFYVKWSICTWVCIYLCSVLISISIYHWFVYVHLFVSIHVHEVAIILQVCMYVSNACIYVCSNACIYVCMYVCMYAYTYVCMYVLCECMCVCVRAHVRMCECMYVCMYIQACQHANIHTQTSTNAISVFACMFMYMFTRTTKMSAI